MYMPEKMQLVLRQEQQNATLQVSLETLSPLEGCKPHANHQSPPSWDNENSLAHVYRDLEGRRLKMPGQSRSKESPNC